METITIKQDEFKELLKTTVREVLIEVLTQRRDLLEEALIEAIEDIGLARAMEDVADDEEVSLEEAKRLLSAKQ